MYERTKIKVMDAWEHERDAELIYGNGVAMLLIPAGERFVKVLPMRRTKDRIAWGYEEGIAFISRDELERAFKRGTLDELMRWGIEHGEGEA